MELNNHKVLLYILLALFVGTLTVQAILYASGNLFENYIPANILANDVSL